MRTRLCTTSIFVFFFFNDTATTEIYTLSLHDALPISPRPAQTDFAGVRSHFERHQPRGRNDQRQWPGPEFFRQREKQTRRVKSKVSRLVERTHQQRQRPVRRSALDAEDFADRRQIKRIGGEPVERVGRERHHLPGQYEPGGVFEDELPSQRVFRVNFEDFRHGTPRRANLTSLTVTHGPKWVKNHLVDVKAP